jgi:hypothetical protein
MWGIHTHTHTCKNAKRTSTTHGFLHLPGHFWRYSTIAMKAMAIRLEGNPQPGISNTLATFVFLFRHTRAAPEDRQRHWLQDRWVWKPRTHQCRNYKDYYYQKRKFFKTRNCVCFLVGYNESWLGRFQKSTWIKTSKSLFFRYVHSKRGTLVDFHQQINHGWCFFWTPNAWTTKKNYKNMKS